MAADEPCPILDPVLNVRWRLCRSLHDALTEGIPVRVIAGHTGLTMANIRALAAEYRNG